MTTPGQTIAGRYDLRRQLGAGAMGSVWLARDTALGRDVAVKSVRGPLVEDHTGSGGERALREARMIARVNHPNAVAIYDVAMHDGHPWLVMEYVHSQDLAALVRDRGPISPVRAAEIGAEVAAALAEVHRVGIVHRDVKPANVLIPDQGGAKITDFGIARGDGDVTLTATGTVWGTPAYFAPEVAAGATPTPKADVWSLGATLYFAVEGTPPHGTDASPLVLLGRIANQPVPPPRNAGPLSRVLARLLEQDPERRPAMTEAAGLLATVGGADAPTSVPPVASPESFGAAPPPGSGRSPSASSPSPSPPPPAAEAGGAGVTSRLGGRDVGIASRPGAGRGRRLVGTVLAVVALAAVGALAAWMLLGPDDDGGGQAGEQPTQSSSAAPRSPTSGPSGPGSPSPTAEDTGPAEVFTPARMRSAVADYYALMPDETEQGFDLLGPSLRSQGFDSYDDFWDGIESVRVRDIQAQPANRTVTATVVFVTDDGRTSTESHRFELVRDPSGRGLLINTDTVD